MRPLAAFALVVLAGYATPVSAQIDALERPIDAAVQWCMFNRACNWTSHASIGAGIVVGLKALGVKPQYGAAASALFYIGKEIRDDAKWGNVLGTFDSNMDMAFGVAGAFTGWLLARDRPARNPPVELTVAGGDGGGSTIGIRVRTR
jgi:hypothetical protein